MSAKQHIPLLRILAEGTAIVISILLAFWIDAWWADRQRAGDERVVLQALLDDLQEKETLLAADRRYNEAILDAITTLLRAGNNPDVQLDGQEVDRLIENTWWYNVESEWDSAPMQSLVSGGLDSVSNPVLLQKISELQITFGNIKSMYRLDESFHHNTFTPYLIENAYLAQLILDSTHPPGNPNFIQHYPQIDVSIRQDHAKLLANTEFQNMLVAKMDRIMDVLNYGHRDVEGQLDELIVLLNEELTD